MINSQPGGVPIYARLADLLRRDILDGRLQPGQALPSERTLGQEFGLGRHTVRRAIAVLRAEGLVIVARGQGVLVKERSEMQDLVPAAGSIVASRMPTVDERSTYDVDEGTPVFTVFAPDGSVKIYPADRWQLRWP